MEREYRKVCNFIYQGIKYQMLLDNQNKYFFLRVNEDESFSYVSLAELIILTNIFSKPSGVYNIIRDGQNDKLRFVPKVLIKGVTCVLTLSLLLSGCTVYENLANPEKDKEESEKPGFEIIIDYKDDDDSLSVSESEVGSHVSFAIEDKEEEFKVDTHIYGPNLDYATIHDSEYIGLVLDYDKATKEDLYASMNSNPLISENFKPILNAFIENLAKKYPNADYRIFNENLKDLEVVECTRAELTEKSLSLDCSGCYRRDENKIYVLKDCSYAEGTWEYQVIFHELTHCFRSRYTVINGKQVKFQPESLHFNDTLTNEALASLFAVSLFDYEEPDIAYQLQSNYHKTILECIDNYTLTDYANHSLGYYVHALDEFNGHNNYASTMIALMNVQYEGYHNPNLEVPQEELMPLYDYISNMYFRKYITSNMSYEQAREVTDELIGKILYDVPEEYHIDTNLFYTCLNNYCKANGISTPSLGK